MAEQGDPAARWDDAYALGDTSRSWFQREPALSLRMLDAAGVSAADGLIDVGGGHPRWPMPCLPAGSVT